MTRPLRYETGVLFLIPAPNVERAVLPGAQRARSGLGVRRRRRGAAAWLYGSRRSIMPRAPEAMFSAPVVYLGEAVTAAECANLVVEAHLQMIGAAEHALALTDRFWPHPEWPLEPSERG